MEELTNTDIILTKLIEHPENSMRRSHIYLKAILCLALSSMMSSCVKDDITQSFQQAAQKYIGFSASLIAETRSTLSEQSTEHLTIHEEDWALAEEANDTRGSIRSSLKGLEVGMYAHSYTENTLKETIMTNHNYYFVDNEELAAKTEYVMWESVKGSNKLRLTEH